MIVFCNSKTVVLWFSLFLFFRVNSSISNNAMTEDIEPVKKNSDSLLLAGTVYP